MIPGVNIDFDGISDEVISELHRGAYAKDFIYAQQPGELQLEVARQAQGRRVHGVLGQPSMSLDAGIYHAWARKFGTYDCWQKDGDLTKYLHHHFPETKVRVEKNMATVGWTPEREGAVKFRKTYEHRNDTACLP